MAALQDNGVIYSNPAELINRAFSQMKTHQLCHDMLHPEMPPIQIDINGIIQLLQIKS